MGCWDFAMLMGHSATLVLRRSSVRQLLEWPSPVLHHQSKNLARELHQGKVVLGWPVPLLWWLHLKKRKGMRVPAARVGNFPFGIDLAMIITNVPRCLRVEEILRLHNNVCTPDASICGLI
jgi:hypothetical protein